MAAVTFRGGGGRNALSPSSSKLILIPFRFEKVIPGGDLRV